MSPRAQPRAARRGAGGAGSDGPRPASVLSVDRVHEALREKILGGTYPPGSRLILTRLAAEHDVSVIPIRDALQRLEAERLILTEPNRGARVADISIADMRDIYETRVVLENHALRGSMSELSSEQLATAESALSRMETSFAAGKEPKAYAHHQAFHFALYEPAGSAWTMHVIRQLWSSAERYVRLAAGVRRAPEVFVAEHREIFAAVASGDVAAAEEKLTANLRTTERLLADTYEAKPQRID